MFVHVYTYNMYMYACAYTYMYIIIRKALLVIFSMHDMQCVHYVCMYMYTCMSTHCTVHVNTCSSIYW